MLGNAYHLNTVYVEYMDGYVYVLGTKNADQGIWDEDYHDAASKRWKYRVLLYKIPVATALNTCASEDDCPGVTVFDSRPRP